MSDVLRRKLGARRPPERPGAVSVETLLRKTMPRDADAVLSLDLSVTGFAALGQSRGEVMEGIADTDLTYLIETEDGARGLAILDAGLTAALIEVQVGGTVSERPAGDRRPTRTDGIVAGEVVDRWLNSAADATAEAGLEAGWPFTDFERVPGVLSLREVGLLLEPVEYRCLEISLSLGGGAKTGKLRLAAPRRIQLIEGRETTTAAQMRTHLPAISVEIRAVLARLPLGMTMANGLKAQQVIPLPHGCLQHVRLETTTGRLIREARLGQLDGKKGSETVRPCRRVAGRGDQGSDSARSEKPAGASGDDRITRHAGACRFGGCAAGPSGFTADGGLSRTSRLTADGGPSGTSGFT